MTWVATAIVVGGTGAVASTAAPIIGAHNASGGTRDSDIFTQSGNATGDPLLAALSMEAATGLGVGDISGFQAATSPFSQIANEINATNILDNQSKRRAIATLNYYEQIGLNPFNEVDNPTLDAEGKPVVPARLRNAAKQYLFRGLRAVGRANTPEAFSQLMEQNAQYNQRSEAFRLQAEPIMSQIQRNRLLAQAGLAETGATAAQDINTLADLYGPQIAQQFQDERNRILQAANAGRFNPGAALGRLGETQALTQRTSAIDRALQLLGGRQGVITNSLVPAQSLAQSLSGTRTNVALNTANIGAAQANAQAQAQQNRNEIQGTGLAAGLGNFGNALQVLGLLTSQGPQRTQQSGTQQLNPALFSDGFGNDLGPIG